MIMLYFCGNLMETISDPKCETKGKNNRYLAAWSYADADENIIIKFY
jgi:hypothetical protein